MATELVVYCERGDNAVGLRPDLQLVSAMGRGGNRSTSEGWEGG